MFLTLNYRYIRRIHIQVVRCCVFASGLKPRK